MAITVAVILVGALVYLAWRRSESGAGRLAAYIGGGAAVLFALIGTYGLVLYIRTSIP